jgi:elongation factor P
LAELVKELFFVIAFRLFCKKFFMAKVSDISKGSFVRYEGELAVVLEYEHRTPGNLRAFYQVRMRKIKSGKLIEQRFRPGDDMEIVNVHYKEMQYLYMDGSNLVCMDNTTYEQVSLPKETLGDSYAFVKEGMPIIISFEGEEPIYAQLPVTIELEVTYTETGLRGDTATRTLKAATLETGAQVRVPLFINIGDKIKLDSRTGDYLERSK